MKIKLTLTAKNGQMQNFLKEFKNEHFLKETTFVIQEMRRKMSDYTVEVNIKDLEDEIKKNIDIIIHNLLKRFIEENKIETLYKIIFTDNWDEEITDFQKNNNLPVEYTDSQYGSASAKTLHIKIGENIKNVIFLEKRHCYL